jgi:hypothetical protein
MVTPVRYCRNSGGDVRDAMRVAYKRAGSLAAVQEARRTTIMGTEREGEGRT